MRKENNKNTALIIISELILLLALTRIPLLPISQHLKIVVFVLALPLFLVIPNLWNINVLTKYRITGQTEAGIFDGRYDAETFKKIPGDLTKLQLAWMYYMRVSNDAFTNLKLTIGKNVYYLFGKVGTSSSRVIYRNNKVVRYESGWGSQIGGLVKPYKPVSFKWNDMSEERFLSLVSLRYDNIKTLDDVFKINKYTPKAKLS